MLRVVQVGAGKVFGGAEFVMSTAFSLGDRFRAGAYAHLSAMKGGETLKVPAAGA